MPLLKAGLEAILPGPEWVQSLLRFEAEPVGFSMAGDAEMAGASYDLGRVSRRYLLLVTLGVFIALRRWIPWSDLARRGFRRAAGWKRPLGFGIGSGFAMAAVYTAMLLVAGWLSPSNNTVAFIARRSLDFALAASFIALLEEWFFRGIMFRAMLRDWGLRSAFIVSGAVFGLLHCVSGGYRVAMGWDPAIGVTLFGSYFTGPGGSILPDLQLGVGLFLLAVLLGYLYLRSGTLWVPIGLHGGMVFFSKVAKKIWYRDPGFPDWLYGDSVFLVSGVACWVLLLVTILLMTRIAPKGPLYRRLARNPR
jgi:membrane protease YdiL (CAAX protease family)